MILRFVPYIGALISAVFPLILAAAVGSGWEMLGLTAALFAVLELLTGQVIEPLIYGHSTGLSPVAIIVSASFWTWLWGPVGLVLATPLTICLVIVGRHVDRLQFLDIILGDQPPLTPPQLVYQRMLAGDPFEAAEQARTFLKSAPLEDYYDTILLGGLRLAADDHRLGRLDDERLNRILATVEELAQDLDAHEDVEEVDIKSNGDGNLNALVASEQVGEQPNPVPQKWKSPGAIRCIPGSSRLDEVWSACSCSNTQASRFWRHRGKVPFPVDVSFLLFRSVQDVNGVFVLRRAAIKCQGSIRCAASQQKATRLPHHASAAWSSNDRDIGNHDFGCCRRNIQHYFKGRDHQCPGLHRSGSLQ